jgi:hypothetical protein
MPRLNPPRNLAPTSVPAVSTSETRQPYPNRFVKGREKSGGREKGQQNLIPSTAREAIARGLAMYGHACGRTDLDGLSAFVYKCAEADLELGARLLMCITPKQVDATITRNDVVYKTIEELDQDLVQRGLPATAEIFQLDYSSEAEVVEAEDTAKK